MKVQSQIVGVKKFKGDVEGKHYDSCKVLVLNALDSSQDTAMGSSVSEYKFGESANFERFRGQAFPFMAELELSLVTNGRTTSFSLVDFKPLTKTAIGG